MTLQEFKAWFEGFSENIDGAPTDKQWKKIKAKVGEIDNTPTSYPVFIRQYPWYQPYWYTSGYSTITGNNLVGSTTISTSNYVYDAYRDAGRMEATQ